MAQDSFAAGASRFEVGRVISTSLAVLMRNLVPFGIISLLIGIPYFIINFWAASTFGEFQADVATGVERQGGVSGIFGMVGIGLIVFMLTNTLTQAAINYGTFQDLRGQRASFGDCLGRGLAMLPKVVVAAILASIGIGIGSMLLLIPGIILSLMWWVFVPAIVVENAGITDSLGRSSSLTSGHRWGIFGLLFLVGVAQGLVGFVAGLIGSIGGTVLSQILDILVTVVFIAFTSVMTAVGYYYLRAEKEGIQIDDIARVFD
ncbi:MAG TPA: hypothetical protein VMW18_13995 [Candidatus Binatia bacterium]|nr:hypothetical protein [Candidatus Binatia bacterium]